MSNTASAVRDTDVTTPTPAAAAAAAAAEQDRSVSAGTTATASAVGGTANWHDAADRWARYVRTATRHHRQIRVGHAPGMDA